MKALTVILIALSLFSCKLTFPDSITSQYDKNPFIEVYDVSEKRSEETKPISLDQVNKIDSKQLRFAVITDVHLGRDRDSNDIRYFHDNFKSFLDSSSPEFLVCLGDLTDDGQYDGNVKKFINETSEKTVEDWFVYCIGNHERHIFDYNKWNKENAENDASSGTSGWDLMNFSGTMGHYAYGDLLSIYKLDNSMRILGQQQLIWLEEALKNDKSKYRIIITHDNITTGGALDQSLFLTGFADIQERNKLYRIMKEYKVGLVLEGHHHKGNIEYHINDYMGELNLAAYHQRKTFADYESEGYFYEAILDSGTGVLTINGYLAEYTTDSNREPDKTFQFKLP